MEKIPVAVLGAPGAVGQRFLELLKDHPMFELRAVCASERSAGMRLGDRVNFADPVIERECAHLVLRVPDVQSLKDQGIRIAFSAMPADQAGQVESDLAAAGIHVFSNARCHRYDEHVPILIPEINMDHLEAVKDQTTPGFIVTNSNCSTSGLAMVLKPLHEAFGLKEVVVSTYQALSGAGYPGVPSLDIVGNIIPHIGGEEEKMELEAKKMLGSYAGGHFVDERFDMIASCVRVGVKDGHTESVTFKTEKDAEPEDVIQVLEEFRGQVHARELDCPTAPEKPIIFREEDDRPQPTLDVWAGEPARARGMSVTVGRVRKVGDNLRLFMLVHNTVRGAAGDSVLNAEVAVKMGYID